MSKKVADIKQKKIAKKEMKRKKTFGQAIKQNKKTIHETRKRYENLIRLKEISLPSYKASNFRCR